MELWLFLLHDVKIRVEDVSSVLEHVWASLLVPGSYASHPLRPTVMVKLTASLDKIEQWEAGFQCRTWNIPWSKSSTRACA